MSAVVYTAIFGDYDVLKQPVSQDVDCDFLCFTEADMPSQVGGWRVIRVENDPAIHSRVQAKRFKILSHEIFPGGYLNNIYGHVIRKNAYNMSIWVDGHYAIKGSTFVSDMRERLAGGDWAMFVHPDRDCIYREANTLSRMVKFKHLPFFSQVGSYQGAVLPHSGLFASGMIVRREAPSSRLTRVHQLWWEEIIKWTYRDQLSLPFVLATNEACRPVKIYEPLRNNIWFDITPHAGSW